MSYLDISITGPVATFTKRVKPLGLTTEIFMKVPAFDLTTMRVRGEHDAVRSFCVEYFEPRAAAMHLLAIRLGDTPKIALKNRALKEYK